MCTADGGQNIMSLSSPNGKLYYNIGPIQESLN
jgi:hypothetical protein